MGSPVYIHRAYVLYMVSHYAEALDPKPELPLRPGKDVRKRVLHSTVVGNHSLTGRSRCRMIHSPSFQFSCLSHADSTSAFYAFACAKLCPQGSSRNRSYIPRLSRSSSFRFAYAITGYTAPSFNSLSFLMRRYVIGFYFCLRRALSPRDSIFNKVPAILHSIHAGKQLQIAAFPLAPQIQIHAKFLFQI